jgi:hypothetical protein
MKFFAFITSLLLFSAAHNARAFDLADHKRIILQAIDEYNACFNGRISTWNKTILWSADLEEDLNVVRKDLKYSHFYNPLKTLNMFRYDSSVRIDGLEKDLRASSNDDRMSVVNMTALGHAVHHLQDMAVPPHVVPVMHWMNDGFEEYTFSGEISSGFSCEDMKNFARNEDLEYFLKFTAMQTLNLVNNSSVEIGFIAEGTPEHLRVNLPLHAFWQESTNHDFGQYGSVGNNFGKTDFIVDGHRYLIDEKFYADFKQAQMKLAVQSTLRAFAWYLN